MTQPEQKLHYTPPSPLREKKNNKSQSHFSLLLSNKFLVVYFFAIVIFSFISSAILFRHEGLATIGFDENINPVGIADKVALRKYIDLDAKIKTDGTATNVEKLALGEPIKPLWEVVGTFEDKNTRNLSKGVRNNNHAAKDNDKDTTANDDDSNARELFKHDRNKNHAARGSETSIPPFTSSSSSFLSSMNLTRDDFYERNYFYRAWMTDSVSVSVSVSPSSDYSDPSLTSRQHRLPPMDILTRYISEHSHQRLELEWNETCRQQQQQQQQQQREGTLTETETLCRLDGKVSPRRYLVATYSCPIESGNRLHRFMNGLLWAVLTNRTFLWRYQNYDVCHEYDENDCAQEYNPNLIVGPGDCEGLIERSPWIPSYDEWKDKLGFSADNSDLVRAQVLLKKIDNATLPYDGMFVDKKKNQDGLFANANSDSEPFPATNNDNIRLIRTGKQVSLNPGKILTNRNANETRHLTKAENLERLESIRSNGIYFLYGMLFESVFTMDPSLDPPKSLLHTGIADGSSPKSPDTDTTFQSDITTVFLHRRHPQGTGIYMWPDHLCLEKMLSRFDSTTKDKNKESSARNPDRRPCHVYVMSDRPAAVELLHKEIRNITHCTSSSTSQMLPSESLPRSKSLSFLSEHGSRAGRGYWEDVALATNARDGMIAFHMYDRSFNLVRTSSALVREIVEFRRVLEHHYSGVFDVETNHGRVTSSSVGDGDGDGDGDRKLPTFFECTNPWKDK